MPLKERRSVTGLQPERADVIVAGLVISEQSLVALQREIFWVSEADLLQGLLWSRLGWHAFFVALYNRRAPGRSGGMADTADLNPLGKLLPVRVRIPPPAPRTLWPAVGRPFLVPSPCKSFHEIF